MPELIVEAFDLDIARHPSILRDAAYSLDATGLALVFDLATLKEVVDSHAWRMVPCQYDIQPLIDWRKSKLEEYGEQRQEVERIGQDPEASQVHKHMTRKAFAWRPKSLFEELLMELPKYKDKCFEHEKETRVVTGETERSAPREIHFELRGSLFVPYTKLPLVANPDSVHIKKNARLGDFSNVLRAVIVGLTTNTLHEKSLRLFLEANGLRTVQSCGSKVPLRLR